MTHMYFSARAEGRISYGHLGRTNSCFIILSYAYFNSFLISITLCVSFVMFLLCKHVRLTCGFNKLMMMNVEREQYVTRDNRRHAWLNIIVQNDELYIQLNSCPPPGAYKSGHWNCGPLGPASFIGRDWPPKTCPSLISRFISVFHVTLLFIYSDIPVSFPELPC